MGLRTGRESAAATTTTMARRGAAQRDSYVRVCIRVRARAAVYMRVRLYTSPSSPVRVPRLCVRPSRPVHTLRVSYGFTRSFGDEKIERETPRWHGSRAPLFGFSCARGSARGAKGRREGAHFCLCLSSRRGEGDRLSRREKHRRFYTTRRSGGEMGRGEGEPERGRWVRR